MVAGIDVGISGAICFLDNDGQVRGMYDMPVLKVGKRSEIDGTVVRDLIKGSEHVFLEKAQAMPGQGIASTAHYLKGAGIIEGICIGIGSPYTLVHPATWKSKMMKDCLRDGKGSSIYRVQQLYPGLSLPRVKDHGKADAILIARYGQIYILGGGR